MSTTYADIRAAIVARISANLASINAGWSATADVAWPNVKVNFTGKATFMIVEINYTGGRQGAIGNLRRIDGTLTLEFHARMGEGTDGLMTWVDAARDLFPAGQAVAAGADNILFKEPIAGPIAEGFDGYAAIELSCPFYLFTS